MLTVKEAATALGLKPRTVYDLFKSGLLPGYRPTPKAIRFDERDVQEYLAKCRSTTTSETSASASPSAVSLRVGHSDLAAFFRKRGVEPKLKPSTSGKSRASTKLRLVAEPETP